MALNTIYNISDIFRGNLKQKIFAVLVLNQPVLADAELLKTIWMAATVRITVDGGTNHWLKFIEENSGQCLPLPDCITGDFDSITNSTSEYFKEKSVKFIQTPDQSETDFTKALRQLKVIVKEKNLRLDHVIALDNTAGRMDQVMANVNTLYKGKDILEGVPIILMSGCCFSWLLYGGGNYIIDVPEDFIFKEPKVGLIPLSGPTNITTSGLKWNLENGRLEFGVLVSTSNTINRKTVEITCDKDLLWTIQYAFGDE